MPEVIQRGRALLLPLDPATDEDIDNVTRPLLLPPVPIGLAKVIGLLARSIDALLCEVPTLDPEALVLRERLNRVSHLLASRMAPAGGAAINRSGGGSEAYSLLLQIGATPDLGRTPLATIGAAYLLAWLDDGQLVLGPVRTIATAIRRQAEWIRSDTSVAGVSKALSVVIRAARDRVERKDDTGTASVAAFNAQLQQHLRRARDFPEAAALAGARQGADLHAIEVIECARWLREAAIMRGDDAALVAAAVMWIGLPVHLALQMPLDVTTGYSACVDLRRGVVQVDLTALLASLSKARPGSAATSDVLVRPLPAWLLGSLRRNVAGRAGLQLRHLLGRDALGLRSQVGMAGATDVTVSFGRLMRNRARPLLDAGMDASLVSYSTLDLRRLAKATRHYCHITADELRAACEQWSQVLGWGATAPLTGEVGIGSRVSPLDETVQACVFELLAQVEAARPGRRSSVQALVRFHEVYAGYLCFMLALLLGLRDRAVYDLGAPLLVQGLHTADVRDKSVRGMPPVLFCSTAAELLRMWDMHCQALSRRLKTIQRTNPALVPPAWLRWLDALSRRAHVTLVATLQAGGTRPAGADNWKRLLACAPLTTKGDFGRHWLPGVLRAAGLSTAGIVRALRHLVPGRDQFNSLAAVSDDALRLEVAAAIDAAVARLQLEARHGLSKWPT